MKPARRSCGYRPRYRSENLDLSNSNSSDMIIPLSYVPVDAKNLSILVSNSSMLTKVFCRSAGWESVSVGTPARPIRSFIPAEPIDRIDGRITRQDSEMSVHRPNQF